MDENENTSQTEDLWQSDDWADLRWAREHSTPQQIARHLLDPQWRGRDYNALDELVEMTHDADLSALDEDDLTALASSELPELRQAVIRHPGTPDRILEDMARKESNTRLLQMLADSGKLSQRAIDLCCWHQPDERLAARMLPQASDWLVDRLSERDIWTSRRIAVKSGRLDHSRLESMMDVETHPEVAGALVTTGMVDLDHEANAIRRIITDPDLQTHYPDWFGQGRNGEETERLAAQAMLNPAPPELVGKLLTMPDADSRAWRTLVDVAVEDHGDGLTEQMLEFISHVDGNTYARRMLEEHGPSATAQADATVSNMPEAVPQSSENELSLDAALKGQYVAFENRITGYIDANDPDASSDENGAGQFSGYEVVSRDGNGHPATYRLEWLDEEGVPHDGPEIADGELTRLRESIFTSPDSWDSFASPADGEAVAPGTAETIQDTMPDDAAAKPEPSGERGAREEDAERERRRGNINRLLDVLPVTMVTKDGAHQVDADEVMRVADRFTENDVHETDGPSSGSEPDHDADAPGKEFDWNRVEGMDDNVRTWYGTAYPDDPSGERIDPHATFARLVESFPSDDGHDFYAVSGVTDSTVRERVFGELSKRLDCEYSDIHDAWTRHTNLDPDLLGDKSARVRREVSDMIGDGPAAFALADSIADHVASDWRAMTVIREADRMNAIDGTDFRKGIKDAISRHPGNDRLLENDGFAGLVYDMVKDGRRFATDAPAVHEADVDGAPNIGEEDINVADSERKGDGVVPGAEETAEKIRMFRITVGDNVINHLRSRGADDAAIAAIADSYDLNRRNGMGRREARMAAEREHGYGATPSVTKSAEDAVDEEHLPHASNERAVSDPAVRPEDGPSGDMDAAARTDASEPERAEAAPSSGMEAGTVSTPELIAKKIELFGIKVGRFEVAQLIRRGAGPEAIAAIADSYDLNLRNGMESGEARLAAEREHGYAPDRTVADATRSEDVDDEPDIDFGSPERELATQIVMQEGGTRHEVREQLNDDDLDRIARDEADAGVVMSDGDEVEDVLDGPETSRPVVAATIEAEQLAFDFDMPEEIDNPHIGGQNIWETKLDNVSNSHASHETEENDARKETTRNDEHHALPVHRDQEDEVPVHGGTHAGTAQGAPTPGDAGDGRLHGRDDEEVRPREDRVHQPLGQDAPTPQEAGQLGSVAQGTQDGGTGKRGSGHQGSGRSPLRGTDRGPLDPDRQTAGSNLERARANVHAIEVLRDLDESGREPTDDDTRALAAYAGWGGAQEAFQEDTTSQPWLEVNGRLRELLSDEEYADARSSTLTAFYTPRPVIDAIWNTLGKAGFGRDPKHPDMVLEPGCGTGNFIRSTPAGSSYGFTGIEADPISAGIARYLCPDDDIIANRMERTGLPESAFDLAVGNVPYSDAIRIDNTVIHDWFIRHSLDTVRPGGLVAVLTSRYTLDKNTTGMRRELARKAELVAACRLPRETFGRQAGTEVVSDILVLRKRDEPLADVDAAWVDAVEFSQGVNANRLFVEHPEYVAGTMTVGSGPFGPQIDVTGTNDIGRLGENVERILTGQLEAYGIGLHDRLGERANEPIVIPDATRQTAMRYTVDENGHIWYGNMYGQVVPAHSRVRNGGDERMAAMLRLRDRTERLLSSERDPETDDETVAQGIRDLDQAYDRFVESYGRLNSKENLRVFDPNATDASLNQLYALEKTNADGFEAKGDTLSKRVVTPTPPMPDHVDEPVEALSISLDRMGHVDLDLIGRLLGTRDTAETSERLGDLIVAGPDSGEPVPADEYLSGDVVGKIDHVERLLRDLAGRPEHDRTNDWLAQNGLDDGSLEPAVSAEQAVRELRQSGAWQSATDPLHTTKAMVEEAWFADVSDAHNGQKMAMASKFIDDCKPGVELLAKNWDADNPQGNALFGSVFEQGWSGDGNGIANSTMRMLYKAVTADPEAIDDRVVATILNTRDFRWGDAKETLQKITDPSLWKVEDLGYRRESRCDLLAMARELRSHPEICEYLYSMDVARLKSPSHHGRYGEYRPLSSMVSVEGLGQWRERRNEWMEAHPAQEPDPERLMELRNLESRLRKSLPDRLTHDEITAKLGSSWIPAGVIRDFMIDTFKIRQRPDITEGGLRSLSVSHDETTGNWQVKSSLSPKLDETTIQEYGLGTGPGRNPFEIVAGALNSTTSNLTKPDPNDPTGKRKVRDPQATAMLYQKRHAVEQAFTEWVWNDPDRTRMLENVYNQRFNRIRPREYDGSYLTFPGISSDIDLYGHQRKAVARILQSEEGTLIAHVVGAGKTFTGVAACHEAKRLGKATKPMIVVPNHLTEQWAKDFLTLYPDANILSMTEADGAGKGAARFWAKVAGGDWDAVIVRQDTFQRMHVSPERRQRYFDRRKSEMLKSIETAKTDGNDFSAKKLKDEIGKMEKNLSKTVKQNEKDRARVDGKLQALRGGENNKDWIDFEDLGVDMLFVDEAHQYKNLAIATTISVPGVDVAAAQKCEDLFDKCEYLRDQGRGANIVFATGTPVSNSMAELYNMQRYLAPGLLKAQGVEAFTSWANTYGSIVESVEVKPEGSGYQIKQRFSKFHNLPELMSTFHNYADLLTADKLDLDVPDCDVIPVAVEPTESQKKAVEELVQRAEVVRDGGVDPSDDNMLNITNDGRKVSLDPKLLDVSDPDIQPMEHGKVQVCAENIYRIWKEHASDKATQLVFCDSSTTASGKWNIQSDLKRRIMEQGIPEDEIMFAAQEKDPQKKQALFDKVRKGEVRVLIGSTGTLGTGTNVQDRLFAIHDLDCPWKPAELEQRQGRVRRQGNMFDKVEDYRYVTVGTFDSYMFQTVERKAGFISQIMNSDSPAREASDVDDTVLNLAQMKALATGDPKIAERMEAENRLTQLTLLKRAHAAQQKSIRFKIDMQLQPTVDSLEVQHAEAVDDEPAFRKAAALREEYRERGVCGLDLGNGPITDRKQAIHDLTGIARRLGHGQTVEAGEYCGMTVVIENRDMRVKGLNAFHPVVGLKDRHVHWSGNGMPDINNSADNVINQLGRIISGNTDTAQSLGVRLENAKADLDNAWTALSRPWSGQKEYDELTDRIAKMDMEIKGRPAQQQDDMEDGMQADLAEATFRSNGQEGAQTADDPSYPSDFPAMDMDEPEIPVPDPCVDPGSGMQDGPGLGM